MPYISTRTGPNGEIIEEEIPDPEPLPPGNYIPGSTYVPPIGQPVEAVPVGEPVPDPVVAENPPKSSEAPAPVPSELYGGPATEPVMGAYSNPDIVTTTYPSSGAPVVDLRSVSTGATAQADVAPRDTSLYGYPAQEVPEPAAMQGNPNTPSGSAMYGAGAVDAYNKGYPVAAGTQPMGFDPAPTTVPEPPPYRGIPNYREPGVPGGGNWSPTSTMTPRPFVAPPADQGQRFAPDPVRNFTEELDRTVTERDVAVSASLAGASGNYEQDPLPVVPKKPADPWMENLQAEKNAERRATWERQMQQPIAQTGVSSVALDTGGIPNFRRSDYAPEPKGGGSLRAAQEPIPEPSAEASIPDRIGGWLRDRGDEFIRNSSDRTVFGQEVGGGKGRTPEPPSGGNPYLGVQPGDVPDMNAQVAGWLGRTTAQDWNTLKQTDLARYDNSLEDVAVVIDGVRQKAVQAKGSPGFIVGYYDVNGNIVHMDGDMNADAAMAEMVANAAEAPPGWGASGSDAVPDPDAAAAMAANAGKINGGSTATAPEWTGGSSSGSGKSSGGGGSWDNDWSGGGSWSRSSGGKSGSWDDFEKSGYERDFTPDDFLEQAGGDRKKAAAMAKAANKKRRKKGSKTRGSSSSSGMWQGFPFNRPPSPIREHVLTSLRESRGR